MLELDHFWVRTLNPSASRTELSALGLVEGAAGVHRGLGTANAVFYFDNVYLELLWVHDAVELAAARVARTGLLERLSDSGASPFGVSFRYAEGANGPLPIPTWDWPLPFLPPDAIPMPVATTSSNLAEPWSSPPW